MEIVVSETIKYKNKTHFGVTQLCKSATSIAGKRQELLQNSRLDREYQKKIQYSIKVSQSVRKTSYIAI